MDWLVRILDDEGNAIDWQECTDSDVDWMRENGQIEGKHFTLEKYDSYVRRIEEEA